MELGLARQTFRERGTNSGTSALPNTIPGAVRNRPRRGGTTMGRRRVIRRWLRRTVGWLLAAYLVLCAGLFALQARLIFPGHQIQGQPMTTVHPAPGTTLQVLRTAAGDRIVTLFGPALTPDGRPHPNPASRPTILSFYGNGSCLNWEMGEFERFRRLGVNVMMPEYVGYGMSGGSPSEANCYATTDAAYAALLKHPEVNPRKIVAAGWSLGTAVAIDLAARKPVAGLVVFSGFTNMTAMARRQFPYVPVAQFLQYRFDSDAKIARVTCPILIGHGTGDPVVPYSMAGQLAAAAGGPVTRLTIKNKSHNDYFTFSGDRAVQVLKRFLESL